MLFSLVAVFPAVPDKFSLLNEEKIGDFKMGLSEQDLKKSIVPIKTGRRTIVGCGWYLSSSLEVPCLWAEFQHEFSTKRRQ